MDIFSKEVEQQIFNDIDELIYLTKQKKETMSNYLDYGNPINEENNEYECSECGKPISKEGVCSKDCFDASML